MLKYTNHLLLLSITLLLTSCFSAKEYVLPKKEIITAVNYRTDSLIKDSLTIATISYKEMFKDVLLQKYIAEGLKNNIDIRKAIQQILISEAYVKQGKAKFFPTVNGTGEYTHQEISNNSQFGGQFNQLDVYELSGLVSWEVDVWGKIKSNKKARLNTYLQTLVAHKAVKTTLISGIASTYYQLLTLDEQIGITKQTIINREKSLETTKSLKESGILTEVAVKQTEAQLYNTQALLLDLENSIWLLENKMAILLGRDAKDFERGELENQEISEKLSIGVPTQLLVNRPDVMQAEFGLKKAFELTNVARSEFYPALTLSTEVGLQSLHLDNLFSVSSLFATLAGGLTQPIFNGRKIKTAYEVAIATQEQAKLDFKLTLLQAGKEVSDALYSYKTVSKKIVIKQKELRAYELATEYSEQLLTYGIINYLDVLVARENTLNTSLKLSEMKSEELQVAVSLYEALGGGWR